MIHPRFQKEEVMQRHPCFSREAHHRYGRMHLPVAPACNVQCRYCVRKFDCANESRPGVSSRVLSAEEAIERVRAVVHRDERITVVGIAGPGDPLANAATYEVLRAVHKEFPELHTCVSTNGLLLPDCLDDLIEAGLNALTVTINAFHPEKVPAIYSWIRYHGRTLKGPEAAKVLSRNQWMGLREAALSGLLVKVNTIYIPGINDAEIPLIAETAAELGASMMNITALIPQGEFSGLQRPNREELDAYRLICGSHLPQISHCRQCRADAAGLGQEDRDMELEALLAKISDEYLDLVF
ncbi:MAG: nitrogenase molybdenum-iron cofactor biosynthesis protein [Nitrospirae bacterium CG08_land_8_20_14_0_20_52_24]|nr:MAG: nitrogenase molybdenum-iron cofactor biosynthesis protein [Nitrospirae bacterium CG08_land_8_20_14_0_20_52_24]